MSKNYQNVNNLKISDELLSFVNKELLKDLDISSENFGRVLIMLYMIWHLKIKS